MFNNKLLSFLSICLMMGSFVGTVALVHASETDAFTFRYEEFDSGIPLINDEVNRRFQVALDAANASDSGQSTSCTYSSLESAFKKQFLRPLYGRIEGFINSTPAVPKRHVPLNESVYKYVDYLSLGPAHLGLMGFGNVIRTGRLLIGTDKFGHFFDEGFHYYKSMRDDNATLRDAMNYGIETENGIFGLETTGVKSYGDMTANFNGAHFWSNVLVPVLGTAVDHAYLNCQEGRWVQVRQFDFLEYIDGAWDEGINCSQFKNAEYTAEVDRAISEMEEKSGGKRYRCPAFPDICAELKVKYGVYAETLLHPTCLNFTQ